MYILSYVIDAMFFLVEYISNIRRNIEYKYFPFLYQLLKIMRFFSSNQSWINFIKHNLFYRSIYRNLWNYHGMTLVLISLQLL